MEPPGIPGRFRVSVALVRVLSPQVAAGGLLGWCADILHMTMDTTVAPRMDTDAWTMDGSEAADGQSAGGSPQWFTASGSGSLQLPLLFLKAGPAGGLRPPSGPATTRRPPGDRPHPTPKESPKAAPYG
jgi:hypothetical protein